MGIAWLKFAMAPLTPILVQFFHTYMQSLGRHQRMPLPICVCPTTIAAQTAQTEPFMFQNVAYRPTVYRTGPLVKRNFFQPLPQLSIVCTSVSKGRDVPRDVPGQTGTGCPVVPLSRDKKNFLSRCPFVPGQGQEQMSRDKTLCPGTQSIKNFQRK